MDKFSQLRNYMLHKINFPEIEGNGQTSFPRVLSEVLILVNQTKWNVVKMKQEECKSYKEVCSAGIERCMFLIQEVRSADAPECRAFRSHRFVFCENRWRVAVRKIVKDIRLARSALKRSSRPEDIVNSNIQVF